jgi:hypothetical protein
VKRLFVLVLCACGPGGGGGGDGGNDGDGGPVGITLEISPPDAVITVLNGAPATLIYSVTARQPNGATADVSGAAILSIDEARLGSFTGTTLTAEGLLAGRGLVTAVYQGAAASVPVTIKVAGTRVLDPAPANAPDLFAAAAEDAARAPTIVYPSDQTMVPPNLGDFEVHFTDADGNDLFEVALTSDVIDLRVYLTGSAAAWTAFLPEEWAVAGDSEAGSLLKAQVRGMLSSAPAMAGTSAPVAIPVSRDDVEGGIYYWAASASGIYRHDFGKPGEPAEQFYTPTQSGRCVACHALSRDGTRMAVTYDGGNGEATVIDVATRTPLYPGGTLYSNFTVFDPSGTRMLTTSGGAITLRDAANAAVLGTLTTPGYATHPDWSPAGDRVCYIVSNSPNVDWAFGGGHLYVQPYDAATQTFGAAQELVPAGGQNIYYPTFSPDGQWILYNQSNEDAYDDGSAEIWAVPVDGSLPPLMISRANIGPGLTNSWARWAPFQSESGGEMSESFYWFTISSKRQFGVRHPGGVPQIWMAPFFPGRAAAGMDPSLPAFRLPFQDLATSNHIAQWTETVVPID